MIQSQTAWWFSSLQRAQSVSFDCFCRAISFLPSRAITSLRKWRLMISMSVGASRVKLKLLTGSDNVSARCTMWHVSRNKAFQTVSDALPSIETRACFPGVVPEAQPRALRDCNARRILCKVEPRTWLRIDLIWFDLFYLKKGVSLIQG